MAQTNDEGTPWPSGPIARQKKKKTNPRRGTKRPPAQDIRRRRVDKHEEHTPCDRNVPFLTASKMEGTKTHRSRWVATSFPGTAAHRGRGAIHRRDKLSCMELDHSQSGAPVRTGGGSRLGTRRAHNTQRHTNTQAHAHTRQGFVMRGRGEQGRGLQSALRDVSRHGTRTNRTQGEDFRGARDGETERYHTEKKKRERMKKERARKESG